MRSALRASLLLAPVFAFLSSGVAWPARADDPFTIKLQIGPVSGAASAERSLSFVQGARTRARTFDVQDGREHIVRGVSLRALVEQAKAPKTVDAVVITYVDGMQIPVRLADKDEVDAIFIALEHGDVLDHFTTTYALQNREPLPCPKVVYGRKATTYTIWLYPTQLATIKLVTWKLFEAELAQPTRQHPDRSGWPLYMKNCQPCHGIGGQGATRGPDFLSNMDAYRRVPPLAVTDLSQHPSLHEKVKGFTEGTMPVLNHMTNAEISTLWSWLHAIHRGATK